MTLSDKEISALYFEALGSQHLREQDRKMVTRFAHAVESEVRKQDTELIRQMLDALENSSPHTDRSFAWKDGKWQNQRTAAITAARARLEGKPCA